MHCKEGPFPTLQGVIGACVQQWLTMGRTRRARGEGYRGHASMTIMVSSTMLIVNAVSLQVAGGVEVNGMLAALSARWKLDGRHSYPLPLNRVQYSLVPSLNSRIVWKIIIHAEFN